MPPQFGPTDNFTMDIIINIINVQQQVIAFIKFVAQHTIYDKVAFDGTKMHTSGPFKFRYISKS